MFYNKNIEISLNKCSSKYIIISNKCKGDICMENIKMELVELIKKIDDEKILNRIKHVVLGVRSNKKGA